eukprot:GFKZ01002574.1.p1 GENE.GFKZ01002574.1~~GFKZ01002574.1.p1  ORF type:complete len:415 (+),score=42.51 GFKZ01002574.1:190-1434(+)
MAAFIPTCLIPTQLSTLTPVKSFATSRRTPRSRNLPRTQTIYTARRLQCTSCSSSGTDYNRDKALKSGGEALVDDFVKSGLNICIGAGSNDYLAILLDAIAAVYKVDGLIDVAFVSASDRVTSMLRERDLPSNMLVNFKSGIDLFIAPVSSMDAACNCLISNDNFAGDKFAARMARQVVLVILEQDLERYEQGLPSVPVQIIPFMRDYAVQSLCSGPLYDLGVRGATLRSDGSCIVDLSLAPGISLHAVDDALNQLPQVVSTGLLLATEKTTTVVATRDMQPIDITAPIHSIQKLPSDSKTGKLSGQKRERILAGYAKNWKEITQDSLPALVREFCFSSPNRADAFVRYVHKVSAVATYFPQIKQYNDTVEIVLRTEKCAGITELDALVAKHLATAYRRLEHSQDETSLPTIAT